MAEPAPALLQRPVDRKRDHVRGGNTPSGVVTVVLYGDYLCPYCRRLRNPLKRLRQALGERLAYVFRNFPNERAHPGSDFVHRAAEAAGNQGRFWEMYDLLYDENPPITKEKVFEFATRLKLDLDRLKRDMEDESIKERVNEDLMDGKRNGVTATPTLFVDGIRYDGAWDFYSMLEAIERPVAAKVQRSARVFASLPASGGLVLLLAAAVALIFANTPLAPFYDLFVNSSFSVGSPGSMLSLTVRAWFSEGLLAVFFLLVGLEIRRELTAGSLSDWRAAILPVVAAFGGVIAPALIYLALNPGPNATGWSVPTATDIAFALGILALLGDRIPPGVRVFVAALAVVDDILSVLTLAIFYPRDFNLTWLAMSGVAAAVLYALNRGRVYSVTPYAIVAVALGIFLHAAGVHAALAGVVLAGFLPTRPAPAVGPLLGQAATALAALEHAQSEATGEDTRIDQEPIWDWASRNLSAASDRLLSPADRIERVLAPWSAYVVLPLFAFSATGINLNADFSAPGAWSVLLGVIVGLVIGKPLGIALASLGAIASRFAVAPEGVTLPNLIGAACLCGIGDTMSLLLADQAFPEGPESAIAKIGVLIGSTLAAALGAAILVLAPQGHELSPATEEAPA